jgi:hypothetical protein
MQGKTRIQGRAGRGKDTGAVMQGKTRIQGRAGMQGRARRGYRGRDAG